MSGVICQGKKKRREGEGGREKKKTKRPRRRRPSAEFIFITLLTHLNKHIQRHTHTSTRVCKRNGGNQAQELGPGWEGRKKGFC